MTRFKSILLVTALSTLVGSTGLQAQTDKLMADVPFAFHAAGQVLPAGNYVLNKSGTSGVFQIRNRDAKVSILVLAPIPAHAMPQQSKLVFLHSGDDYVLSEIAIAGSTQTNALTSGQIEKNMTRKLGIAGMISVPLHQ